MIPPVPRTFRNVERCMQWLLIRRRPWNGSTRGLQWNHGRVGDSILQRCSILKEDESQNEWTGPAWKWWSNLYVLGNIIMGNVKYKPKHRASFTKVADQLEAIFKVIGASVASPNPTYPAAPKTVDKFCTWDPWTVISTITKIRALTSHEQWNGRNSTNEQFWELLLIRCRALQAQYQPYSLHTGDRHSHYVPQTIPLNGMNGIIVWGVRFVVLKQNCRINERS